MQIRFIIYIIPVAAFALLYCLAIFIIEMLLIALSYLFGSLRLLVWKIYNSVLTKIFELRLSRSINKVIKSHAKGGNNE